MTTEPSVIFDTLYYIYKIVCRQGSKSEKLLQLTKFRSINKGFRSYLDQYDILKYRIRVTGMDQVINLSKLSKNIVPIVNINHMDEAKDYLEQNKNTLFDFDPIDQSIDKEFMENYGDELKSIFSLMLGTGDEVTDENIGNFSRLEVLDLDEYPQIIEGVSKLTNLKKLITNQNLNDDILKNLTRLVGLDLNTNLVTSEGVKSLTNLTHLNLSRNNTVNDEALSSLSKLKELKLGYPSNITDEGLSGLTGLTSLDIQVVNNITDNSLSKLTNLVELYIFNHDNSISFASIKHLTNLKTLMCDAKNFNNDELAVLEDLVENFSSNVIKNLNMYTFNSFNRFFF